MSQYWRGGNRPYLRTHIADLIAEEKSKWKCVLECAYFGSGQMGMCYVYERDPVPEKETPTMKGTLVRKWFKECGYPHYEGKTTEHYVSQFFGEQSTECVQLFHGILEEIK